MFQNGDSYEGEWENFLMHGKGVYYYSYGGVYEGYFQKGTNVVMEYLKIHL